MPSDPKFPGETAAPGRPDESAVGVAERPPQSSIEPSPRPPGLEEAPTTVLEPPSETAPAAGPPDSAGVRAHPILVDARSPDSAGVRVQPILVYALFMVVGVALDRLLPLPFLPARLRVLPGWILLAVGVALIGWTLLEFLAARVSPETTRPARALIVRGPFRVSRNPIYLGGLLACVGGGLLAGSPWMLVMTVPLAILTDRAVIRREERYLGRRFGDHYRDYSARVRRWI